MAARVVVNAAEIVGPFPHFWEFGFGSERPFMVLREAILDHYRMGRDELGFRYVRAHGIFHDELGVYRLVDGKPVYGWRAVDAVYDRILALGLRPFVELSFMPAALASGTQSCFYWQGNVTPPRDWTQWGALVEAFVRHLVERYGLDEVRQWYFEVWNEPNLRYFWAGSQEDYWRLYDWAAAAVKRVDVDLRVGGPATAAGAWVDAFVRHCLEGKNACTGGVGAPFDFVSYHGYPTDAGQVLDGEHVPFTRETYWREMARRNARYVHEALRREAWGHERAGRGIEIHVTEWNSTAHLHDPELDGSNQAAFICRTVKDVAGYVDSFSFWTLSDIFEEGGWPEAEFHGGFGLVTVDGVCKPSFNAFRMLRRLGDRRLDVAVEGVPPGVDALATAGPAPGTIQILVWNHVLPATEPATTTPEAVCVELHGAGGQRFTLQQYLVDRDHSNAYTAWREMGSPPRPDARQLAELKQRMELEQVRLERGLTAPAGGPLRLDVRLSPASATLVLLAASDVPS
ncbi:MAG: beta-xylosidase [Bacillota bacterium]